MTKQTPQSPPQLPLKTKLVLSTVGFMVDFVRRKDGCINRRLLNWLDFKVSPSPDRPIRGVKTTDITVDKARNLWFRLHTPTMTILEEKGGGRGEGDICLLPVVFYFHGGGFAFLSASSLHYNNFCSRLARRVNAVVISVNYRLAPEHRHPSQLQDCLDVIKFVDSSDNKQLIDEAVSSTGAVKPNLKHSFVGGDSAGANLAHQVVMNIGAAGEHHELGNVKLIGVLSLQPFFGGEERTEAETRLVNAPVVNLDRTDWMWRAFLPEGSDRDHPLSNVFGPNSGTDVMISRVSYPPTIIFVGGFDPLQDWQKRYYEGLRTSGKEAYLVQYPNAIHTFYAHPELPESSLLIKEVKEFMQKQISTAR
ncbi:hypothetical protein Tsubulata_005968 [Turnera subulata]|uniref:Alpha/beta hydrolase fold-3 domain-containing protein n=1 Tax=Turnera subulata TaxID=218843 RepID=A0A9Q0FN24_9ROSI|nr:hypothetical protein Tsubulata_005968 [Turnera subulata]